MSCVVPTTDTKTLSSALRPFLPSDVVLCTDSSKALAGVARSLGLEHHAINVSVGMRVNEPWHIQNVNAYHSHLKAWIARFRGVATCYLANYLGWFRAISREPGNKPKPAQWLALALGVRG